MTDTEGVPFSVDPEKLMDVFKHAAANERAVIEFNTEGGQLTAMDVTEHVSEMESQMNTEVAGEPLQ